VQRKLPGRKMKTSIHLSRRVFLFTGAICTAAEALWLVLTWGNSLTFVGKIVYLVLFSPCLLALGCSVGSVIAALWATVDSLTTRERDECRSKAGRWSVDRERLIVSGIVGGSTATAGVLLAQPRVQELFSFIGGPLVAWYCICGVASLVAYGAFGVFRKNGG
jgi:hypothetical protein